MISRPRKSVVTKNKVTENAKKIWHFENSEGYPLCRMDGSLLTTIHVADSSSTLNPAYVTCSKCLEKMAKNGITPEKDGWRNEQ